MMPFISGRLAEAWTGIASSTFDPSLSQDAEKQTQLRDNQDNPNLQTTLNSVSLSYDDRKSQTNQNAQNTDTASRQFSRVYNRDKEEKRYVSDDENEKSFCSSPVEIYISDHTTGCTNSSEDVFSLYFNKVTSESEESPLTEPSTEPSHQSESEYNAPKTDLLSCSNPRFKGALYLATQKRNCPIVASNSNSADHRDKIADSEVKQRQRKTSVLNSTGHLDWRQRPGHIGIPLRTSDSFTGQRDNSKFAEVLIKANPKLSLPGYPNPVHHNSDSAVTQNEGSNSSGEKKKRLYTQRRSSFSPTQHQASLGQLDTSGSPVDRVSSSSTQSTYNGNTLSVQRRSSTAGRNNISKSLSNQKLTCQHLNHQPADCSQFQKRGSLNSLCASGYKFKSDYVRESVSQQQFTGRNTQQRIHAMKTSGDNLRIPEVSCRRYSLPTVEIIEEYQNRRNSQQRGRSDSFGASFLNLLRPNRSQENSRRGSAASISKSQNLRIPRKDSPRKRRYSAAGCQERRKSSLMSSLLDIYGNASDRPSPSSRRTSVADFVECIVTRKGSGVDPGSPERGGGPSSGKTWFQSIIISQQDHEENQRKAEEKKTQQLIVSLLVFIGIVSSICAMATALAKEGVRALLGFSLCYSTATTSFIIALFYLTKIGRPWQLQPRCALLYIYLLLIAFVVVSIFWPTNWMLTSTLVLAQSSCLTVFTFLELRKSTRFWSVCTEMLS